MEPPDWNSKLIVLLLIFDITILQNFCLGFVEIRITKASLTSSAWCYSMPLNKYEIHSGCKEDLARLIGEQPKHPLNYAFREFYCYCEHYLQGYEMCKKTAQTLTNWCCGRLKCDKYFAKATVNFSRANTDPFSCLKQPTADKDSQYKPDCYGITEETTTVRPPEPTTTVGRVELKQTKYLANDQPPKTPATTTQSLPLPAGRAQTLSVFKLIPLLLVATCAVLL